MPSLSALLALGLAMVGGLALSRLMKILHLPNVTGYLFAGLLIGPYLLPLIFGDGVCLLTHESVQSLAPVTDVPPTLLNCDAAESVTVFVMKVWFGFPLEPPFPASTQLLNICGAPPARSPSLSTQVQLATILA